MLEFSKNILKFKYEGEECKISFPTSKQAWQFRKDVKDIDPADAILVFIDMLVNLGLKEEIANQLELEHLEALMEKLMPDKKK